MVKKVKVVKGFKAFGKGLVCRGFQYKEGKTYKTDKIEMCIRGFHFCENPLDVLNYYYSIDSEFCEVESKGEIIKEGNKFCASKIKIGVKMELKSLIGASIDFIFSKAKKTSYGHCAQLASSGDCAKLASSGDCAQLASSGYGAQLASSGNDAQLVSSGYDAQLASSGNDAKLVSSGHDANLASSGYGAKLASSGDDSQLASSGYGANLVSSGYGAKLASSGNDARLSSSGYGAKLVSSGYGAQLASSGGGSICAGIGINNYAKGKIGSWIVLAEWKFNSDVKRFPKNVKSVKIDGTIIKEDVFYKLENNEFVEVK